MKTASTFLAGILALGAAGAEAATIVGLAGGDTLIAFDSETAKPAAPVRITGSEKLVGIDVRPADGLLYGVTAEGKVVTIDVATGAATAVVTLKTMLPAGVVATVDFNPVADRLRLIGSDGTNLRANLADGAVTVDGALNFAGPGASPRIVAGAYTNAVAGAKETVLFDIDGTGAALFRQAPPNDGVLNPVGKLGIEIQVAAFDIGTDGKGGNTAYLLAAGRLHKLDLATGAATAVAGDPALAAVTDIAVLPLP
ncbi:DUF4394 domain-containing protein [Zavarzinia compransoris]|uniref:DUF4394 domain-containing protein n=1 Tax=Zavarzinia compransoris TaxID=1264899 RepID=A0A317DYQ4_9PROT|nr:DUF4394 domain-containing protein [Zavarzinia compransoris]PWR17995.1 hypothetical protein DKG75_20865 [Zavarzinia compransoris]TDP43542.1 uncharacterized protein DUF4394 [Zavarzinia compransoris]